MITPRLILLSCALAVLAGCASTNAVRDAETMIAAGRYEEGLARLDSLAKQSPRAAEIRAVLLRNRALVAEKLERDARNALDAERLGEAEQLYRRLLALDPENASAKAGMQLVRASRERSARLAKAEELLRSGDLAAAERALRDLLREVPNHRRALALMARIAEQQRRVSPLSPALGPELKKRISLEFREVNLKAAFDAVWDASGVNFVLDRDVRNDAKVSLFVRGVTVEEAIDALLISQQLAKKIINSNTFFIYPKTPQKTIEYLELVVRNFFLAHADAKQIQAMLKTILKTKDVFIDEKRNLVVIRDSQEAVDMAEKLIRAHDQAEPEVMLALDVIEIKRSKLSEIGVEFPGSVAFSVANPIPLDTLRNLSSSGINVGIGGTGILAQLNLTSTTGDSNTLANPRIRVRNREKAKIHVGDRLPVVTTTSSAVSTFVGQTVNYLDVGLKLEVEPQVMLDDDVVIKINLEVSSATKSSASSSTALFYDIGTRNTSTVLTIRDGETQVLAGLIRDDELESTSRIPGLGDIPVLGRLFANERRERGKTEIILAITPQVIRNLVRPRAELTEYPAGTESGRLSSGPGTPAQAVPRPPQPAPAPPRAPAAGAPGGGFGFYPQPAPGGDAVTPVPVPGTPVSPTPAPAGTAVPPATAPTVPAGGVIPMIDFEPPPGVGSPRGGVPAPSTR